MLPVNVGERTVGITAAKVQSKKDRCKGEVFFYWTTIIDN